MNHAAGHVILIEIVGIIHGWRFIIYAFFFIGFRDEMTEGRSSISSSCARFGLKLGSLESELSPEDLRPFEVSDQFYSSAIAGV